MSTDPHNNTSKKLLPTRLVRARYNVCDRTLSRWGFNPALNFPKPKVINGRKYYDDDELTVFDRERTAAV